MATVLVHRYFDKYNRQSLTAFEKAPLAIAVKIIEKTFYSYQH